MSAHGQLAAIVPAKCFARAKTRLSAHLDAASRAALAERLLRHVLQTLGAVDALAAIWVLTDDERGVGAVARELGCGVVRDVPGSLGAVVDHGLAHVQAHGARAALVCMADLPRLTPEEVGEVVAALHECPLVLAADRRGNGTNLLGVRPPDALSTSFGHADSYTRHLRQAHSRGLDVRELSLEGARHDVDSPGDLLKGC